MLYCDKCGYEFRPKLKTRNRTVNIKETYFKCPKCRAHYTAYYTNSEARRLQRDIRMLAKQDDQIELQKKRTELEAIMNELREKYKDKEK